MQRPPGLRRPGHKSDPAAPPGRRQRVEEEPSNAAACHPSGGRSEAPKQSRLDRPGLRPEPGRPRQAPQQAHVASVTRPFGTRLAPAHGWRGGGPCRNTAAQHAACGPDFTDASPHPAYLHARANAALLKPLPRLRGRGGGTAQSRAFRDPGSSPSLVHGCEDVSGALAAHELGKCT